MNLHPTMFQYLQPTPEQIAQMQTARDAVEKLAIILNDACPEGPDKTYMMRKLREVGMWANVSITREADGSPRK